MIEVAFYPLEQADTVELRYAVVAAKYGALWVGSRRRDRETWEMPGGHREAGESILAAASRELWEETGAAKFRLTPVGVYSVFGADGPEQREPNYGMLYFGEITAFGPLPASEIAQVKLFSSLPQPNTYPAIQPLLFQRTVRWLQKRAASGLRIAETMIE